MPARGRADRVALLDKVVRRCRGKAARTVANFDGALEDCEVRLRRDRGGLVQEEARACRDQEEGRGKGGDECERTTCPPLGKWRYRDKRHEGRRMRVVDRITNFS